MNSNEFCWWDTNWQGCVEALVIMVAGKMIFPVWVKVTASPWHLGCYKSNLVTWPPQRNCLFKETQLSELSLLLETYEPYLLFFVVLLALWPSKCTCQMLVVHCDLAPTICQLLTVDGTSPGTEEWVNWVYYWETVSMVDLTIALNFAN
jgi:hypothetical protein